METDTDTDTKGNIEPKGARLNLAGMLVLVEALRRDHDELATQVEGLREGAAARDDLASERLDHHAEQLRELVNHVEVIASGIDAHAGSRDPLDDGIRARLRADDEAARAGPSLPFGWPEGAAVRYIGSRDLKMPRPGVTNGATDTVHHRDVFRGEAGAWLREHHPDAVEPYPRPKA